MPSYHLKNSSRTKYGAIVCAFFLISTPLLKCGPGSRPIMLQTIRARFEYNFDDELALRLLSPSLSSRTMPLTPEPCSRKKRIAIVGSGVAGIAAAWALKNSGHEVHIYEAADRLGGHTNTVDFQHRKFKTAVDTGFIVLNTATYPNFINFLKTINVPTKPTEMTFAVSRDAGLFEWSGTNPLTLFAQPSNLFAPSFWRMLFDIFRFNQYALDLLINSPDSDNVDSSSFSSGHAAGPEESIGKYLEREGYSDAFRDDYLIPMTAAVWSTSPDKCSLEFPAVTLVRFLWNHHLLTTIGARPQWLTLPLGSKSYIDAALFDFPKERIHLKTLISKISPRQNGDGRLILTQPGSNRNSPMPEDIFDKVILCTHAPTSLKIIKQHASGAEKEILGAFSTSHNTAILHSDISLLPKRRLAWAAWNYLTLSNSPKGGAPLSKIKGSRNIDQVCLTYNMNILQHIPRDLFGNVLVTLNPLHRPAEESIQGEYKYEHPLYTVKAMEAQKKLLQVQDERGVLYAGAWTKYGFHEDGFSSGLEAALRLGADVPFEYKDSRYSRGRKPVLGLRDYALRVWLWGMIKVLGLLSRVLRIMCFDELLGLSERSNGVTNKYTNGEGIPSWSYIGSEDSFDDEKKVV